MLYAKICHAARLCENVRFIKKNEQFVVWSPVWRPFPLDTRRCCDVKSTLKTLIQRHNNQRRVPKGYLQLSFMCHFHPSPPPPPPWEKGSTWGWSAMSKDTTSKTTMSRGWEERNMIFLSENWHQAGIEPARRDGLSTGVRSSWTHGTHARPGKGITDFRSTFPAVYLCFSLAR